jgi:hypothetical protein
MFFNLFVILNYLANLQYRLINIEVTVGEEDKTDQLDLRVIAKIIHHRGDGYIGSFRNRIAIGAGAD